MIDCQKANFIWKKLCFLKFIFDDDHFILSVGHIKILFPVYSIHIWENKKDSDRNFRRLIEHKVSFAVQMQD